MRNIVWRLILALGAGLIVSGLCFNMILQGAGVRFETFKQERTQRHLEEIKHLVKSYRQENGQWPASIADINYDWGNTPRSEREIPNGWHRPIIYERHGSTYRLLSYGADGKPGGVSFNCDLTSDNPNPPEAEMSRLEILRHPSSQGMESAALICGGLVALITFLSIRDSQLKPRKWLGLALQLVILIAASAAVSTVITSLHVPSGH